MSKQKVKFEGQFLWNSYGDWIGCLLEGHIWDPGGGWIGWVDANRDVYKADGEWIGTLSKDGRILKKRTAKRRDLNTNIPRKPAKPDLPGRAPLPPSFAELSYSEIDVVAEDPDIFKKLSDMRPDME